MRLFNLPFIHSLFLLIASLIFGVIYSGADPVTPRPDDDLLTAVEDFQRLPLRELSDFDLEVGTAPCLLLPYVRSLFLDPLNWWYQRFEAIVDRWFLAPKGLLGLSNRKNTEKRILYRLILLNYLRSLFNTFNCWSYGSYVLFHLALFCFPRYLLPSLTPNPAAAVIFGRRRQTVLLLSQITVHLALFDCGFVVHAPESSQPRKVDMTRTLVQSCLLIGHIIELARIWLNVWFAKNDLDIIAIDDSPSLFNLWNDELCPYFLICFIRESLLHGVCIIIASISAFLANPNYLHVYASPQEGNINMQDLNFGHELIWFLLSWNGHRGFVDFIIMYKVIYPSSTITNASILAGSSLNKQLLKCMGIQQVLSFAAFYLSAQIHDSLQKIENASFHPLPTCLNFFFSKVLPFIVSLSMVKYFHALRNLLPSVAPRYHKCRRIFWSILKAFFVVSYFQIYTVGFFDLVPFQKLRLLREAFASLILREEFRPVFSQLDSDVSFQELQDLVNNLKRNVTAAKKYRDPAIVTTSSKMKNRRRRRPSIIPDEDLCQHSPAVTFFMFLLFGIMI